MFHDISKLGLEIYFLGLRITIRHVSGESFQVVLHFGFSASNMQMNFIFWLVKQRFNEFTHLHKVLVSQYWFVMKLYPGIRMLIKNFHIFVYATV